VQLHTKLLVSVRDTRGIWKVKNVLPLKKIIDNRKEKEYAGYITHLHLLLHIVTLDIEALVVP
jgi:3-mercaptopyruvate sulfurtransferase SseA